MKLEIARKRRFDPKSLSIAGLLLIFWLFGRVNTYCGWLEFESPISFVLITMLFSIPLIFILNASKSYGSYGFIRINSNHIDIHKDEVHNKVLLEDISLIKLSIKGVAGDLVAPWMGGMMSGYGLDGSGSIIEIHHSFGVEIVNVVFESQGDLSGLKVLLHRLKANHSVKVEVTKMTLHQKIFGDYLNIGNINKSIKSKSAANQNQ